MEDEDRASGKIRSADVHKYIVAGGGYRAAAFFLLLWAFEHSLRVCPPPLWSGRRGVPRLFDRSVGPDLGGFFRGVLDAREFACAFRHFGATSYF